MTKPGCWSVALLKLPEMAGPRVPMQEESCEWQTFEEVAVLCRGTPLLHAGRLECVDGPDGTKAIAGSIVVHVMLDYSNLSFISAQSPYVEFLRGPGWCGPKRPRETVEFTVYGWSRRPLLHVGERCLAAHRVGLPARLRVTRSVLGHRVARRRRVRSLFPQRPRRHLRPGIRGRARWPLHQPAELAALTGATYALLLAAGFAWAHRGLVASGRGLLREVRASFYRKLFIAFVAAAVVPVLVLAFVTRAYIATLMQSDLEMEAARTAASASRVVVDVGALDLNRCRRTGHAGR